MTIPGVIAEERFGSLSSDLSASFNDVIFQTTWDGTDGGTNAIDESFIHAPLTFGVSAKLSAAQHLLDASTSLRTLSVLDYVSAPPHPAYDFSTVSDFTIETYLRPMALTTVQQIVGVWQDDNTASLNQWRICYDIKRFFFDYVTGGAYLNYSAFHNMLINTWYYVAWCRYAGNLRCFMGIPGGTASMIFTVFMPTDPFDKRTTIPLFIGGNTAGSQYHVGGNAFFQHTRITRAARYRTDASFAIDGHKWGFGSLFPPSINVPDVIYAPFMGQVLGVAIPSDDVFPTPVVQRGPTFVNDSGTNGATSGNAGAPALVGSRTNGNLLIAFAQINTGGQTVTVSGAGWTLGATHSDANASAAWAWRMVDGTETAPTFNWTTNAVHHQRMFQFRDTHPTAPIGATAVASGASANLLINGGVGLTTTGVISTVMAITLVNASSQVLPLPAGYIAAGASFNDSNGSDRTSFQYQLGAGTVSGPVNLTITSAFWHGFMIELKKA